MTILKYSVSFSLLLALTGSFSEACKKTEFGNDVDTSVAVLGFISTHVTGLDMRRVNAVYLTGSSVVVETLDKDSACSARAYSTETSADCQIKVTPLKKTLVCGARR
jgi:hypothetical protein